MINLRYMQIHADTYISYLDIFWPVSQRLMAPWPLGLGHTSSSTWSCASTSVKVSLAGGCHSGCQWVSLAAVTGTVPVPAARPAARPVSASESTTQASSTPSSSSSQLETPSLAVNSRGTGTVTARRNRTVTSGSRANGLSRHRVGGRGWRRTVTVTASLQLVQSQPCFTSS